LAIVGSGDAGWFVVVVFCQLSNAMEVFIVIASLLIIRRYSQPYRAYLGGH
jgi:hypothetical protein